MLETKGQSRLVPTFCLYFGQLRHELINIPGGNKQFFDAFCQPIWIFGNEQQAILCAGAGETIPAFIFLEAAPFIAADLVEFYEHAIIKVGRRKVDCNSAGSNNVCSWRAKEHGASIKKRKSHNDHENLPARQPNLAVQKIRHHTSNREQNQNIPRRLPNRNGRTVNIKLPAIGRVLIPYGGHPRGMMPLHH